MNPLSNNRGQRSSDPYRIARKTHSPADSYDSSKIRTESEAHSRSASDSSTSRLASQPSYDRRRDDYYTDDPYAPRQANYRQHMRQGTPESHDTETTAHSSLQQKDDEQRLNSYLPYSHHPPGKNGELYQPPATSMLLESEHMASFTSPHGRENGVGSLLQDNIVMDMVETPIRTHHKEATVLDPPLTKKKRRRCFGLGRKRMAAIVVSFVVVIVIVWYFVWPRTFDMTFKDANMATDYRWTSDKNGAVTAVEAAWNVSMEANNDANWVPTHVHSLDLSIYDEATGVAFAKGTNDTSFVLAPNIQYYIFFNVSMDYKSSSTDPTLQHLQTSCLSPEPSQQSQNPQPAQQSLHLLFEVTYHIAGLAWSPQTRQNVELHCPQ